SVDASCWIASLNGDCIAVNKKYMDTLQVSLEDCLGYGWVKMVAPGQDYISKWNNHIREASLASFESVFRGRAGKGIKTFRSSVRPWLDHDFSHLGYIGVLHEIKGEPDFVTHLRRATNGG
ncbi:MAG: PAS domain-containing protein, partial [Candidatus Riesia sp.]|nr:PAS domain-containing protein [Candidatus Riesia sp.]